AEADELAKKNVPVFTVGLGNRDGARIPEASASGGYLQFKGEPVITRLHDDVLHAIAQKTGGAYVPVGLASMATTTLGTLYRDHLRRIAARDQEEIIERRHVERYQIFLLPGLLLLVAASCFSRGRLTAKSTRAAVFAKPLQSGKLAFLSGIAGGADGAKPAMEAKRPLRDLTPPKRPLKNISAAVTIVLASLVARGQSTNTGVTSNSGVDKQGPESLEKATVETGMRGHDAAWKAARLLAAGRHEEAARLFLDAAKTAPLSAQQKYRYNAAVALYRAGKFTEAAQILRGLLREASTPEVSVCTGLGAALYREAERKAGEDATNLVERARLLREAGEAFKLAARTERGDTSAQHNMAVVLRKLPEAEEQARIAQLMANYGKVPAANLLNLMLLNQRRINEESRAAFTNNSPSQILHLEALARQQKENAELWIPLKNKLLAAVSAQPDLATNHQYAARLEKVVESLRDHMLENAESLRDLDPSGHPAAKQAEWGIYQIWKGVAPFPLVLEEAIRRQTNCIVQTSDLIAGKTADLSNIRTEQQETSELTTLFGERFRLAVPEGGIPATTNNQEQSAGCGTPGSTTVGTDSGGGPNGSETAGGQGSKPVVGGLSAEMRQQILALAEQAIAAQQSAIKHLDASQPSESLVQQRVSHNLLCEIRKLLPKEQTASEPGAEEKKQPGEEAQPPERRSPGPDQNSEVPTTPAEQPTSQDAKEKEKEKEKEKRELTDGEIQNLLQQALEREKTYDTERKLRNRRIPMLPRERDW
ncbi:MAG: tetratricopeptide repeat protein, partial [Kiritimatiellae bacterium]|nr:tetratricopeptide repeat protein [Kiritimatiellia bacterium]